jgi:hypothetical protein
VAVVPFFAQIEWYFSQAFFFLPVVVEPTQTKNPEPTGSRLFFIPKTMNQPDQFMAFVFTSKTIGLLPAIEGRHDCTHRGRRCSIYIDEKMHPVSSSIFFKI